MTPDIHQRATEAAAPPQRGELEATQLIKTTQTTPAPTTSAAFQTPLFFLWSISSASSAALHLLG